LSGAAGERPVGQNGGEHNAGRDLVQGTVFHEESLVLRLIIVSRQGCCS